MERNTTPTTLIVIGQARENFAMISCSVYSTMIVVMQTRFLFYSDGSGSALLIMLSRSLVHWDMITLSATLSTYSSESFPPTSTSHRH